MIAVVCAVPRSGARCAGLGGPGVEVHLSGMGAAAAARAGARIAAGAGPRALLAAGFCGALAADLRAGDLVAADEVRGGGAAASASPPTRSCWAPRPGGAGPW